MNYPSNSKLKTTTVKKTAKTDAPVEKKPKVEKVVTGDVVRRRKPLGKRFRETFLEGDDIQGVAQYVAVEVVAPAVKDTIADALTQGIERMIFGDTRSLRRRSGSVRTASSTRVDYNGISKPRGPYREDPRPSLSRQARRTHDFDEILLETRVEAEEVIDKLYILIDQYGQASVNDLYELVGITGDYTDEKWGWTALSGANAHRTGDGYLLNIPAPEPLS